MKTGEGLALFMEASVGNVPYIFGTYGQILTERLLLEKRNQYPAKITLQRYNYARAHYIGKRVTDCYGAVKRYKWSDGDAEIPSQDATPIYRPSEDMSADMAYKAAKVKGPISTIPERRGLIVHRPGHAGVYVGNGYVIENRGFDHGTIKSKLADRNFTDWFEDVGINYDTKPEPIPDPTPKEDKIMIEIDVPQLKKGDHGSEVFAIQSILKCKGFTDQNGEELETDSSFGSRTTAAVKKFQESKKLSADGIVGTKTWNALINS